MNDVNTALSVLVIEQNPMDQQLIRETLSSQPFFHVMLTCNYHEARAVLLRERVDVLVMNRPHRPECLSRLRRGHHIPTVMLTDRQTTEPPPVRSVYARKPRDPAEFAGMVTSIQRLWLRHQLWD